MTFELRPPQQALIMHFTHIDNLPSILAAGRLAADAGTGTCLMADVGDQGIKGRRRRIVVDCGPKGCVGDYVPFYFAPRSPMMHRIACDHRDNVTGRYLGGDDPLVYLVSSVDRVVTAGLPWVASDGNCAAALTRFVHQATDLAPHIDWPLMTQGHWANTREDPDRERRRAAEFLVHRECPLPIMLGFVTRTEARQTQLRRALADAGMTDAYTDVRPSWYYGFSRRRSDS